MKTNPQRRILRWRSLRAVLGASVLLAACSPFQAPTTYRVRTYLLSAHFPAASQEMRRATVLVSESQADAGFDTTNMAYTAHAYELDYFAKNEWIAPPAQMIAPLLVKALDATGRVRAVRLPTAAAASFRLDTRLERLEQDFTTRPSDVRLAIRATLVDLRTGHLLASRTFDETVAASSDNPYGGVAAANVAAQKALERIAAFVVSAISPSPTEAP
ncbi:MAG: ABC-type transport auxiliary lipoprotein family protein [Betaproteobacteria bacterium]|nr:ABC-type transport auxiliary lipoprotein family protein [Betaproteobacteria bacterium]